MERFRLDGKVALVTGAGSPAGIGFAAGRTLAQLGALVTIASTTDRIHDRRRELAAAGLEVDTGIADLTSTAEAARLAADVTDRHGRIDILVNNAGIAGPSMPVVDYPVDQWKRVIDIDLNGPFLCCRAVVPHMVKAGYGRIVNIASIAGKEGNPNAAAYAAAKGGLIAFTKALGKELAQAGVLVNCVTPAAAQTAILEQVTPEFAKYMLSKIPMGRFVKVEEIAALVLWLASEECSFSTGAVFDISGGRATY